jgi:hypothetical protein
MIPHFVKPFLTARFFDDVGKNWFFAGTYGNEWLACEPRSGFFQFMIQNVWC